MANITFLSSFVKTAFYTEFPLTSKQTISLKSILDKKNTVNLIKQTLEHTSVFKFVVCTKADIVSK